MEQIYKHYCQVTIIKKLKSQNVINQLGQRKQNSSRIRRYNFQTYIKLPLLLLVILNTHKSV